MEPDLGPGPLMAQAGAQGRAQVKAQPMRWSNVINVYKYTWIPSFKGTHSLIAGLTLRALTYLSFGDSSAGNPSWVQADIYRVGRGQLRRWRTTW